MTFLRAAGVRIVGYVPTKTTTYSNGVWTQTGFRTAASVTAMLNLYSGSAMGPLLNGIFVDEVSTRWQATTDASWGDHTAYYRSLFAEIRALNYIVVANPGSWPPDGLLNAATGGADTVVVFEGSITTWDPTLTGATCLSTLWDQTQGSFAPGPWCRYVPNWDGVDSLITTAERGAIGSELAALIYGATASSVSSIRTQALAANVTSVYVTTNSLWNVLPSWWCHVFPWVPSGSSCTSSPPPP